MWARQPLAGGFVFFFYCFGCQRLVFAIGGLIVKQLWIALAQKLLRLPSLRRRQAQRQVDDFFQVFGTGDWQAVAGVGAGGLAGFKQIVAVTVLHAALHHFVVHRQHKHATRHVEKQLDGLQHFQRFFGQAAVQVVDKEQQVQRRVAVGQLAQLAFKFQIEGVVFVEFGVVAGVGRTVVFFLVFFILTAAKQFDGGLWAGF